MKKTLILIGVGGILVASVILFKQGMFFRRETNAIHIFSQLEKGEISNPSTRDIISLLGEPDAKDPFRDDEIWSYGPSLNALKSSKAGDTVGINIYVDKRGDVVRCLGIHKD